MKLHFFGFCIGAFVNSSFALDNPGKVMPNVIIILADDLVYGSLGCYGSTKVKTPHIDILDNRTLVFFISDNGGLVQYSGGYTEVSSNGPLRGAKAKSYEGGHRVPAIAWWPGKIKAGRITDQVAMTTDILPTVMSITGIKSG